MYLRIVEISLYLSYKVMCTVQRQKQHKDGKAQKIRVPTADDHHMKELQIKYNISVISIM